MKPIILIPAYQPDENLEKVIRELIIESPDQKILLVNDGSSGKSLSIIENIAKVYPQVDMVHHAVNQGKGQALKTGLNYFLLHYAKDNIGVVTADADGQHATADILRLSAEMEAHPNCLCLGCRSMGENVPLRRKLGNNLTIFIFNVLTGVRVSDTQTGLRGIPTQFMDELLHSKETGYDFELDMLIRATTRKIKIREITIQTIYQKDNQGSHFNYIRDSLKIYFVFLRFSMLSIATAIIDFVIFASFYSSSKNLLLSLILGRVFAGTFQFLLGKFWVFRSPHSLLKELVKYVSLVSVLMALSYGVITPMVLFLKVNPYIAKIITELTIFLLSFSAQRLLIYNTENNNTDEEMVKTNWDTYYNSPFKTAFISRRFTEEKIHTIIKKYGAEPIHSICELGGGNSYFFPKFRQLYPEVNYTIVDSNQRGLDLFFEEHRSDNKIKLLNEDVLLSSIPDELSDVIFSIGLIEHFMPEGTARAIKAHFYHTQPGSLVIITFPTPTWLYRVARGITTMVGAWRFPDERPLSMNEVLQTISQYGEVLDTSINWPIVFTQGVIVARSFGQPKA